MYLIKSNKVLLLSILTISSICSCLTSKNVIASDINVHFEDKELVSSSIFIKQSFVKLQSDNPQSLIGSISRVLCADSLLFILDERNNKVVSFDYEGNFISSTMDMIGHAHNEYIHLTDAAIDEANRLIYVYCDRPYQMLVMDYNLEVKQCVPMNELLLEIVVDSQYVYALYPNLKENSKYDIRYFKKNDLTGRPQILIEYDKAIPRVRGMGKLLNKGKNYIYACLPFDNVIYRIADAEIRQYWDISMQDKWFDYRSSKDLVGNRFFSANTGKNWAIQNIAGSDSQILFNTNQIEVFELSIDDNKCTAYSRLINENIPFSDSWLTPSSGKYDISYSIPAASIVDYFNYYNDRNEPLPDNVLNPIITSTSIDDNPIIVLANLK